MSAGGWATRSYERGFGESDADTHSPSRNALEARLSATTREFFFGTALIANPWPDPIKRQNDIDATILGHGVESGMDMVEQFMICYSTPFCVKRSSYRVAIDAS